MKVIFKNSSLSFNTRKLLNGNIVLVKSAQSSSHRLFTKSGQIGNSNDDVNNGYYYSLVGLPIGTKITVSAGTASKVNLYNASQISSLARYVLVNFDAISNPPSSVSNLVISADTNTYTLDANNQVVFQSLTVTKSSHDEKCLCVCGDAEPTITIEVSGVVNSGEDQIDGTIFADNTQFSDEEGNTKSKAYSRIYKYEVVKKSYYFVYTKFSNNDSKDNKFTLVKFVNEDGVKVSTCWINNTSYVGSPFAVLVPDGAKYMLVQGANNSANYLDGKTVSTEVYEMEVVNE